MSRLPPNAPAGKTTATENALNDKVPERTPDNTAEPYHALVPVARAYLIAATVVGGFLRGFLGEESRRREEQDRRNK